MAEDIIQRLTRIKRAVADAEREKARAEGQLRSSLTALLEALDSSADVDKLMGDPKRIETLVADAERLAMDADKQAETLRKQVEEKLAQTEKRYGLA